MTIGPYVINVAEDEAADMASICAICFQPSNQPCGKCPEGDFCFAFIPEGYEEVVHKHCLFDLCNKIAAKIQAGEIIIAE